jgi:hypothetical protein
MTIYVIFPSPNTDATNETLARWHAQGYRSAVLIDNGQEPPRADVVVQPDTYPGYVASVNQLAHMCIAEGADIVIASGDDADPDPNHSAEEIGRRFVEAFPDYFGVMQPTGDKFGALADDAVTRAAVTPWIGKAFAQRAYQGNGPYFSGYRHFYADAEIMEVAQLLGCWRECPEFMQFHRHHSRGYDDALNKSQRATVQQAGLADRKVYLERKAAGFPGHI